MPLIKTYLKSGQVIETVCDTATTRTELGVLASADWKNVTEGERVMYGNTSEIAAITEVIEAKESK